MDWVEADVDLVVESTTPVPSGTAVVSLAPPVITVHIAYDYEPFRSRTNPAFDFVGDRLHPDGTIDRDVTFTSLPGRTTIERNP